MVADFVNQVKTLLVASSGDYWTLWWPRKSGIMQNSGDGMLANLLIVRPQVNDETQRRGEVCMSLPIATNHAVDGGPELYQPEYIECYLGQKDDETTNSSHVPPARSPPSYPPRKRWSPRCIGGPPGKKEFQNLCDDSALVIRTNRVTCVLQGGRLTIEQKQ